MVLADQKHTLRILGQNFAECDMGRGRAVVISGSRASGKTEVIETFCDHAAESDTLVLTASGTRSESDVQLGVLNQLVHSAVLPGEISEEFPDLLAQGTPSSDGALELPHRPNGVGPARNFCEALLQLSKHRRILIVVDDLHASDQASVRALLYMRLRMRSARILLVLTEWRRSWGPPSTVTTELTRRAHTRIELGPMSPGGVGELLAERWDSNAAEELAGVYHRMTAGNPILVRALVDDNPPPFDSAETQRRPVVSRSFEQAVMSLLHGWEEGLLRLAQGVAVFGDYASNALVARVLDVEGETVDLGIDILTEAGLVEGGTLRHPAVKTTLLGALDATDASLLHRRAAELLYQQGVGTVDVARLIIAADDLPGPWAIRLLREAGREALTLDDTQLALKCLHLAQRRSNNERERGSILAELTTVKWRISPSAATRSPALYDALFEGELRGRKAATAVRNLLWQGRPEEASQALDALHRTDGLIAPQTSAELDLTYQWIYGPRRVPPTQASLSERQQAAASVDPWLRAASTLGAALHDSTCDGQVDNAWQLLRSAQLNDTSLEVIASGLLTLIYADQLDGAAEWCDGLIEEATQRRVPTWQAVLNTVRADIALHQGNVGAARALVREALDLLPVQNWEAVVGYPLAIWLTAATAMGEHEEADMLAAHVIPDTAFVTIFGLRYLHARGQFYLATDRLFPAFSDFQHCGNLMRKWNVDIPVIVPWRSGLAQVHARMGNPAIARDMVTRQMQCPGASGSRIKGISLRVLASMSEVKLRPSLLRDAIDHLRASGDRLELARAMAHLGRSYHDLGEPGKAAQMIQRAEEEAKRCQAWMLSRHLSSGERAPAKQDGQTVRPSDPDCDGFTVLSEAEQRVASEAALGYTNREISQRLFITPSTVEQHLTRVYRKLKVEGRQHLPSKLLLPTV